MSVADAGSPGAALPRRLPGIDVLRAVAASSVVIEHIVKWPWGFSGAPGIAAFLWRLFEKGVGSWGVSVFFVLSGLCIHLPVARRLAQGESPRIQLAPYFKRRLFRIYPPHAVVIGLSWLVAATVAVPPGFGPYLTVPTAGQFWAHVFLVHTFVPGAIYSINAVLWTIAIEAHFYVVYPLLLALRRRFSMSILCGALLGLKLLLYALDTRLGAPWRGLLPYSFVGRWWEWVLGAVIAERLAGAPFRALPRGPVLAVTVAAAVAFCAGQRLPHGVTLMTVIAPLANGLIVWWAARLETREDRWLDRALVAVGVRSYSLYLTHPITLVLVAALARRYLPSAWSEVTVAVVACYAVTWMYFALIERRFLAKPAVGATATRPAVAVSPET